MLNRIGWGFGRRYILLATCMVAMAVLAGSLVRPARAAPPGWPKLFTLIYCWGATDPAQVDPFNCPQADLILYKNGTLDVSDGGAFTPNAGTWYTRRGGRTIVFELDGGAVYEGTRQSDGSYFGSMTSPFVFGGGLWEGGYVP